MKYEIRTVNGFKKQYRKLLKGGRYKESDFERVMRYLSAGIELPTSFQDHQLTNNPDCHELHIKPDWLLVYRYDGDCIELIETGSHTTCFRANKNPSTLLGEGVYSLK